MGHSLSWIAIRGAPAAQVHAALGLKPNGLEEEIPESPFCGAELATGWYVVIADHDLRFTEEETVRPILAALPGCEAVSCGVEEHAMVSMAFGWREGREAWSVLHGPDETFEVPVARAEAATGFRHDTSEGPFQVLEPISAPKAGGWFRRLFS